MLLVVLCEIRGGVAQTRPHGYKVPRSGRMPPGPGRMQVPTGRPAQHPASSELRPYVDASGKPACNATGLRKSAYCVEDNSYPTQLIKSILRNVNVDLSRQRDPGEAAPGPRGQRRPAGVPHQSARPSTRRARRTRRRNGCTSSTTSSTLRLSPLKSAGKKTLRASLCRAACPRATHRCANRSSRTGNCWPCIRQTRRPTPITFRSRRAACAT
uniref:Uncharacterized protein n=2 Tax=Ixodes ricinus TaxID=34613 RepID=A0A090XD47_IXORI